MPCDENVVSFMDASVVAGSPVLGSMTTDSGKKRGSMPADLAILRAQNRGLAATQTFPPLPTYLFTSQPLHKPAMDEQPPMEATQNPPSTQLKSDIDVMAVLNGLAQQWKGDVENEASQGERGEHDIVLTSCKRKRPSQLAFLNEL